MATISLAMIVKNEHEVLARCLKSAKTLFDEIIIVDTGSTDDTKIIAQTFATKVVDFEWNDDFSCARNYAFSLATCDYVMWLDADDVFSQKLQNNITNIKALLDSQKPDVVMMKYDIAFDKANKPTFSYYRERIVKNRVGFVWQGAVHEVIVPSGKIVYCDYSVEHRPLKTKKQTDRNLKIYQGLLASGKTLSLREQYYYARELMFNGMYDKAIETFNKFLSSKGAWKENLIGACLDLAQIYSSQGNSLDAKRSLVQSFVFDKPRAEVCCKLGDIFIKERQFDSAIYWFNLALKDKINLKSGAFVQSQYYNVYPLLQLCVCYYQIGDIKNAKKCNDKVGKIDKENSAYKSNKFFFDSKIK